MKKILVVSLVVLFVLGLAVGLTLFEFTSADKLAADSRISEKAEILNAITLRSGLSKAGMSKFTTDASRVFRAAQDEPKSLNQANTYLNGNFYLARKYDQGEAVELLDSIYKNLPVSEGTKCW